MRIIIEDTKDGEEELVIIKCRELSPEHVQLINSFKQGKNKFVGVDNDRNVIIDPEEIYYIESVDNKVFLYTKNKVYSSKYKLYEIEEQFSHTDLFRASKSTILNARKIRSVSPTFSGRFEAVLLNGEKVDISRQYVKRLREILGV